MERKLIVQGKGGYTIYLPKKWVDKKGLKQGDIINIIEKDTTLIIGSPAKGKKEIVIEVNDENRKNIRNIITHLYRRGFDSITVNKINPKILNEIKNTTKDLLLGFEITERDENRCRIENISEPTEAKYDVLLRRIFLIIKETQNIVLSSAEEGKFSRISEVEEFKKQQDKFILFCRRILVKEKYEKDPVIGWELLTFLMHIEHAYYYLYKHAAENKTGKDRNIAELLKGLQYYFGLYYNAYFKKDMEYIHKINNLKNKFQFGKCIDLISKGKNSVVFSYIREIFRLIQIGTSPILSESFEEKIG